MLPHAYHQEGWAVVLLQLYYQIRIISALYYKCCIDLFHLFCCRDAWKTLHSKVYYVPGALKSFVVNLLGLACHFWFFVIPYMLNTCYIA